MRHLSDDAVMLRSSSRSCFSRACRRRTVPGERMEHLWTGTRGQGAVENPRRPVPLLTSRQAMHLRRSLSIAGRGTRRGRARGGTGGTSTPSSLGRQRVWDPDQKQWIQMLGGAPGRDLSDPGQRAGRRRGLARAQRLGNPMPGQLPDGPTWDGVTTSTWTVNMPALAGRTSSVSS
jgi:hypothetical protein